MDIGYILFLYIVIVLSAVFHEYAHAYMAFRLGDRTAFHAGRLTLNPFAHLDIFGTVVLPLLLLFTSGAFIGWAKPVPYNPQALSDQKRGSLKVAAAGPLSNIAIALALTLVVRFGGVFGLSGEVLSLLGFVVYINLFLALFNLIPVPPLDGSKILGDLFPRAAMSLERIGMFGLLIALFVGMFLLSPVVSFLFSVLVGI